MRSSMRGLSGKKRSARPVDARGNENIGGILGGGAFPRISPQVATGCGDCGEGRKGAEMLLSRCPVVAEGVRPTTRKTLRPEAAGSTDRTGHHQAHLGRA